MALAVLKRGDYSPDDKRVSEYGNKKRAERHKQAFQQKVSAKVLAGALERYVVANPAASVAISTLTKSVQKNKAKVTTPEVEAKPVEKAVHVTPPVVAKPVKSVREPIAARLGHERLLCSVPSPEYATEAASHHSASITFTENEKEAYLMARKFSNDRHHARQDDSLITATVDKMVKATSNKGKTRGFVDRSVSLQVALERIATFECVTVLTDDNDQYVPSHVYSKNNITVGGVKITLGMKKELVCVPATGTTKLATLSLVKRSDQIRSRTPKHEATQPLVEAVTVLEDLPPWTARAAVERGYGSLEEQSTDGFDEHQVITWEHQAFGSCYLAYLPRAINVFELPQPQETPVFQWDLSLDDAIASQELTAQAQRDQYLNGLADLPRGAPHYLVDTILGESSNDDGMPTPPPPTPVAVALTEDNIDAELKACFAALAVEWQEKQVEGHFHPATLQSLHKTYGMGYDEWTMSFVARRNRGVLLHQHFEHLSSARREAKAWAKEVKQDLHKRTVVRTNVHKYRQKFNKATLRKNFRMMEDLRISREYSEMVDMAYLNNVLYEMECKFPSYNEADEQRYEDWLCKDVTPEFLQAHLQCMEIRNGYNDLFSVVNHAASYRELRPQRVLAHKSLVVIDAVEETHPPTGAAVVTQSPASDKVGQSYPDFLIVEDVIVPFKTGTRTLAPVQVPSKISMLVASVASWLHSGGYTMLATG